MAITEDIGDGDHTTLACIDNEARGKARLVAKQTGIIAGLNVAQTMFQVFDSNLSVDFTRHDGDTVQPGDLLFTVSGKVVSILQMERLVLNVLQRMSGIATQTHEYARLIADTNTQILDTRKTTPGMRQLDKEAVRIGGGTNHRMGLYDMIMIKDNHVDFAGGIPQAVEKVKNYLKAKEKALKIEVEARNMSEVEEILQVGGVDRIMLDNFSVEDTRKAVELINGRMETESSGGITKETIADYAHCGVDFISVGALTHQIKSLDMSLLAM